MFKARGSTSAFLLKCAGEVFVDAGAAPFDFDKKNDLNYFVRTVTSQGEQRIYWGKDFPRALEEAGAKVGDSITATRVASKPVTVEEIQEQPTGQNRWFGSIASATVGRSIIMALTGRRLSKPTTVWSKPRKTAKDSREPHLSWSPRGILLSWSSNARNW
jgi:hypothetical protein